MPVNKMFKSSLPKVASTSRQSRAKAPGTRVGTLQDWREGSGKSGKTLTERRNALRDGR